MTEFRRRKDDGRVFPVRKKAYGISRQLAYADVQALRKDGKRARLIKTNRRLDLFAPYVSDIPGSPAAETMDVEKPKASTKKTEKKIPQEKIDMLNQLGLVTKNGKPDLNNGVLNEYFSERTRMKATIKDGKLTFIAIDPSTISLIMETMDTNLPDGYLIPTSYSKDFSMEWTKTLPPDDRRTPRFPPLDYSKDSWTVRLEGEELKKFVKALRSVDGDVIRFNLLGGTDKSSVQLCRLEDREDSHKPAVIPLDTMNASSNRKENKDVPEGWSTAEMVLMPKEYVTKTLTAMLGRKSYMNPTDQVLTLQLKRDYPLVLKTRRIGPNGEHIEIDGAVAPRMGE
jgi:hypothetical protein